MRYYYITFRSVTYAQRGEKLLRGAGLNCSLLRTPRWMESQGCGYALGVRTQDLAGCLSLLKENQLPLRRVYVRQWDGTLEVVEG